MADLKKKFIDILFEDDLDEQEYQEELYDEKENKPVETKSDSPILAKDILYRKPGQSAFINLNEKPKEEKIIEDTKEIYEMSSQISPIFGLIRENKPKVVNVNPETTETQTSKPADSHLDIITSPIYGYGNKEDAIENDYDVKDILDDNNDNDDYQTTEDDELHNLFDNEEEVLNSSYDSLDTKVDNEEEISLFRLFGDNK